MHNGKVLAANNRETKASFSNTIKKAAKVSLHLLGLLRLGSPQTLDEALDATLRREGNLSETKKRDGTDAGRHDPGWAHEGLGHLGHVVGDDVIEAYPRVRRYAGGNEDAEGLVDESLGHGIWHQEDSGCRDCEEGRKGVVDMRGRGPGVSLEEAGLGIQGHRPPHSRAGRLRRSLADHRGLRLHYAEHDQIRCNVMFICAGNGEAGAVGAGEGGVGGLMH